MPATSRTRKPTYGIHPGVAMMVDWVKNLKTKSGRSLDEWLAMVEKEGPATEEERRDWLKREHGLGTNTASWLAERSVGKGSEDADPDAYLAAAERYVEEMYAGPKESLRPLYERLLELGLGLAKDTMACPCKTIVPIYRNHVIAQIKPSTRTRIDFGLALGKYDGEIPERLIDTGGKAKGDRITHRIPITSLEEIDDEARHWLNVAYELDGQ